MRLIIRWSVFLCFLLVVHFVHPDTLHFVATTDSMGNVNYNWQSPNNWYYFIPGEGYTNAFRVPGSGDVAIVHTAANAAANSIGLMSLVVLPGITISGGNFSLINLATSGGSSFSGSVLRIQTSWYLTNGFTLTMSTATIDAGAFLFLEPGGGGSMTTLSLFSSTLYNIGQIILSDMSVLAIAGGTNQLWLQPGALLTSSGAGSVTVNVIGGAYLNFYLDGVVRGDPGVLTMSMGNTVWTNISGLGKFETSATNGIIEIYDNFSIPPATTNLFTGPGITRFFGGPMPMNLAGLFQVGAIDPSTQAKNPGTAELVRGTFTGAGPIRLVDPNGLASQLIWDSGTFLNTELDVGPGSVLILTGNNAKFLSNATINISGTTIWTNGNGDFNLGSGAVFNNVPGALFDVQNDALIKGASPSGGIFNNAGTFRKSAGSGDTAFYFPSGAGTPPTFNNTGLLDVQSGRVILMGGTNSGQFNVASGHALAFWSQTNVQSAGATFTGSGLVSVAGTFAATLELNTDVTLNNLDLESRSLIDGAGNLSINQSLTYIAGTVQGSGALNIASSAGGLLSQGNSITLSRNVNNSGSLTNAGPISAGSPVLWNNTAGGSLVFQGPSPSWSYAYSGAPPALVNRGLLMNLGAVSTVLNWALTNLGQLQVMGSELNPQLGLTQIGGSTTVAAGALLKVDHGPFLNMGGTLSGSGTVQANVVNSGIVHPGASPGILTITGAFTNNPDGTVTVTLAGLSPGSGYSLLASPSGQDWLAGTLRISYESGFTPALSNQFQIVIATNGTVSGKFANLLGIRPGNGLVLVPVYGPTNLTLLVAKDPVVGAMIHLGGSTSFSFPTTSGFSYVVEYTDSLNPIAWKTVETVAGDGTSKPVADSAPGAAQRFYRVRFQ